MTPYALAVLVSFALGTFFGVVLGLMLAARLVRFWGGGESMLMESVDELLETRRRKP